MANYFSSSTSESTLPEITEEHIIIRTLSGGWHGSIVILNGEKRCRSLAWISVINFTDNTIKMFNGETQVLHTVGALNELMGKTISLVMGMGSYGYAGTTTINRIKVSHNGNVVIENVLESDKFLIKSEGKYYLDNIQYYQNNTIL